ncbi:hypothetical protein SCB49_05145 [unidentified eubacterium SCB49]|nr:hypothetical protein SCB49_05145 [unidentified eubacterium SCB49]
MNPRILAIFAALTISLIYGVNHTIAKDLMPGVIKPYGFILLRVTGAMIFFWGISLFYKSEKVERRDWWRFLACSTFGMVLNMNTFFKGLELSTPINSSVVITLSPVFLLVLSAFVLRERISLLKGVGIFIGLIGALVLILFGVKTQANAPNIPVGNLLFLVNALSYASYLVFVKKLVGKYKPITLLKFLFLFAFLINLPIGWAQFSEIEWASLDFTKTWKICFVVIGTTVLTYLLDIYALKQLKPSTLGVFIYMQPLVATIYAIVTGADQLTSLRVFAASLIFFGVYLATRKKKVKIVVSD